MDDRNDRLSIYIAGDMHGDVYVHDRGCSVGSAAADVGGAVVRAAFHMVVLAFAVGVWSIGRVAEGVLLGERALGGGRTRLALHARADREIPSDF